MKITDDEGRMVPSLLGKRPFMIGADQAREIGRVRDITETPKMSDHIETAIDLTLDVHQIMGEHDPPNTMQENRRSGQQAWYERRC